MKRSFSIVLLLLAVTFSTLATDYDIVRYGARADTTVLSTKAIQKAIDVCFANGGGRVVVPSGSFRTGSIFLKDNVFLYLAPGATLYGSTGKADYIPVKSNYEAFRLDTETIQLIYAEGVTNSGICGEGTIDGQGRHFQKIPGMITDEGILRPHLIRFINCRSITVKDVTLRNSGCWMQHYLACDDVRLSGLRIFNRATKNNDGIDIDGCHNVVISDVIADTDDDCITLKSTSPRLCENIAITGCVVSSHCNGIKLGTESVGGFRNILISDCVVKPSSVKEPATIFGFDRGISAISLEMVDGGVLEDVMVSDVLVEGTQAPIFVRLGNRARPYSKTAPPVGVGVLRNVTISNVMASGVWNLGSSVTGIPGHPVENIILRDITIEYEGNPDPESIVYDVKEHEKGYPEADALVGGHNGKVMPASGIYFRHVRGLRMQNVVVRSLSPDSRKTFIYEDTNPTCVVVTE